MNAPTFGFEQHVFGTLVARVAARRVEVHARGSRLGGALLFGLLGAAVWGGVIGMVVALRAPNGLAIAAATAIVPVAAVIIGVRTGGALAAVAIEARRGDAGWSLSYGSESERTTRALAPTDRFVVHERTVTQANGTSAWYYTPALDVGAEAPIPLAPLRVSYGKAYSAALCSLLNDRLLGREAYDPSIAARQRMWEAVAVVILAGIVVGAVIFCLRMLAAL